MRLLHPGKWWQTVDTLKKSLFFADTDDLHTQPLLFVITKTSIALSFSYSELFSRGTV